MQTYDCHACYVRGNEVDELTKNFKEAYGLLLVRNNVLFAENKKANLRIAELEKKIEYLCRDQENYEPILVAENQRLKEQIKAIRELPRYAIETTFGGGWKAVPAEGYEATTFVNSDELEALLNEALLPEKDDAY